METFFFTLLNFYLIRKKVKSSAITSQYDIKKDVRDYENLICFLNVKLFFYDFFYDCSIIIMNLHNIKS